MTYLDKRLHEYQDLINDVAPPSVPVMLLLDNINLYQSLEVDSSFSGVDLQSGNNVQKENAKFQKVFDSLVKQMWEAQQSSDLAEYSNFISRLASQRENWANAREHHGRTVLHKAV